MATIFYAGPRKDQHKLWIKRWKRKKKGKKKEKYRSIINLRKRGEKKN